MYVCMHACMHACCLTACSPTSVDSRGSARRNTVAHYKSAFHRCGCTTGATQLVQVHSRPCDTGKAALTCGRGVLLWLSYCLLTSVDKLRTTEHRRALWISMSALRLYTTRATQFVKGHSRQYDTGAAGSSMACDRRSAAFNSCMRDGLSHPVLTTQSCTRWKKRSEETQTLRAGCSKTEPKKFADHLRSLCPGSQLFPNLTPKPFSMGWLWLLFSIGLNHIIIKSINQSINQVYFIQKSITKTK